MTVIAGTTTLTPIASVDTSSSDNGVSMFTLLLDSNVISAGNLFQFEYYIATVGGLAAVANGNNFIALEDAVSTQGISNQFNIAVPSLSNVYSPTTPLEVKIRAYVTTGTDISVSTWSNTVPVYNPPDRPVNPAAFMVFSDASDELLYVQIANNASYNLATVKFIISYSYTDDSNENQWVVSEPVPGTLDGNVIIFRPPIPYQSINNIVFVAVNAVFSYTYLGATYYTVSQISETVQATEAVPEAPVLAPIVIPTDYLVYSTPSTQQVVLKWTAPTVEHVLGYDVASYQVVVTSNDTFVETITGLSSSLLTYTYSIPADFTNPGIPSSLFSFKVNAVYTSSDIISSNSETVNTFTYATEPENLLVVWANAGASSNRVDMLCTFNNPSNNGQGQVVDIQLKVLDLSSNVVYSETVPYFAGGTPYSIYITNLATTPTGSVVVYMVNTDTNAQTSTGLPVARAGASGTANYVVSDLPFIYDVVHNSGLSFKVLTHTALVNINQLVGPQNDTTPPSLFGVHYSSDVVYSPYSDGEGGSYEVSQTPRSSGDFDYTFTFNAQWLLNAGLITNLLITAANSVGIQVEPAPLLD